MYKCVNKLWVNVYDELTDGNFKWIFFCGNAVKCP
jgi:hypothetical protein